MRTTIRNIVEAKKREREEAGDAGFSLIELIVVVVILGILAAIAIPIFLNIQGQAKQNSLATITANAASQAASALAQNSSATPTFTNLTSTSNLAGVALSIAVGPNGTGTTLTTDNFCVTGSATGLTNATSGPGC